MKKILVAVTLFILFAPQNVIAQNAEARKYYDSAATYFGKGQYRLAIKDYSEAINLDPRFTIAYMGRGDSYLNKYQYDLAIQDYTEAIRLDPKFVICYKNRAYFYKQNGQYDLAIQDYSEAIRLDP